MADETTPATPTTPAAPHADFAKPPAAPGENRTPPAPAPAAPPTIAMPIDEYQRFRSLERQLADYQTQKQVEIDAKEQERIKALADKGEVEKALDEQKKVWESKHLDSEKRYKDLEAHVCNKEADALLSSTLNGCVFAGQDDASRSEAAKMLKTILRGEIEAVRLTDGTIQVRDKASGRPAADVLRERLSDPKLAFFFAPNSRGGSGSDGARPNANPQQPQPGSLEAIAAQYRESQGQYASMGLGPIS